MNLSDRIAVSQSALTPYAVPVLGTLGREHDEPTDETRTPFQRDRDRIIHTQAFRRLQGKTQVFVAGEGDHYRTRLTHSMEVAQIGRDIARTIGLNEDLTECIALAHDLGHPPFGHSGEAELDAYMETHGSHFEHNEQSRRIVTLLETHTVKWPGLNLNREVLEGLMKHEHLPHGRTLEAQIADCADQIAYTAHDTDDGMRAGLFTIDEVISASTLARHAADQTRERGTSLRGALIHLLVMDLYEQSSMLIGNARMASIADVYKHSDPLIGFSEEMTRNLKELRTFLWDHMYMHPDVHAPAVEGQEIIRQLCTRYEREPNDKIRELMNRTGSTLAEAVKDYVAGMTDTFAKQQVMTSQK